MLISAIIFAFIFGIRRGLQFRPLYHYLKNKYVPNLQCASFQEIIMIQIPEFLLTLLAIPFFVYSSHFFLAIALILGGSVLVWSGYRETQARYNCFNPELSEKCQTNSILKKAILSEFKTPQFYINPLLLSAPIIITLEKNSAFYIASVLFLVIKMFIEAIIHTFGLFMELKNEKRRRSGIPRRTSLFLRLYDGIKKLIIGEVIQDAEIIRRSEDYSENAENAENDRDPLFADNKSGGKNNQNSSEDRASGGNTVPDNKEDGLKDVQKNNQTAEIIRTDSENSADPNSKSETKTNSANSAQESDDEKFDQNKNEFKYHKVYDNHDNGKKYQRDHEDLEMVHGYKTFLHQFFSVVIFVTGLIIILTGVIRLFPDP